MLLKVLLFSRILGVILKPFLCKLFPYKLDQLHTQTISESSNTMTIAIHTLQASVSIILYTFTNQGRVFLMNFPD